MMQFFGKQAPISGPTATPPPSPADAWSSGKGGEGSCDHAQGALIALSRHVGVKIGGGQVRGFGLARAPVHKEAVGESAQIAQDAQAMGILDAATVIVARGIHTRLVGKQPTPRGSAGPKNVKVCPK
jgi:hypothetical protein